jgi:hypothetical protein
VLLAVLLLLLAVLLKDLLKDRVCLGILLAVLFAAVQSVPSEVFHEACRTEQESPIRLGHASLYSAAWRLAPKEAPCLFPQLLAAVRRDLKRQI